MTDNDIIKALECCMNVSDSCFECPFYNKLTCTMRLKKSALDLINRQKAEIERLKKENDALREDNHILATEYTEKAKAEAIKEFAEGLIHYINDITILPYTEGVVPCIKTKIKLMLKEMTEENDA